MEPWINTLMLAGLPLVSAFSGFWISGRRESKRRLEDQHKEDVISQRQAVADFLIQIRNLNRQFNNPPQPPRGTFIAPSDVLKERENRNRRSDAVEEILTALDVLYLQIFDPTLVPIIEKMERTVTALHENYISLSRKLTTHIELRRAIQQVVDETQEQKQSKNGNPEEDTTWLGDYSLTEALDILREKSPFTSELKNDLETLRETARINLQPLAKGKRVKGMYTPFDPARVNKLAS